ncbi:MAG TPA: tRNA uridine-5-carboxymethylaminomethyl(34) synthesis GTPase MnmE [Hyphomicrobiaceae bacterium]|nr:tRNA uridine-5-carboxymethylaminomethyl(34) synthesis GTPase MnmE [Hyphomicrobiaceae bacterium]
MQDTDTICALSSAPGISAVAVVRISGPNAGVVLERMCGGRPRPRVAALRRILDGTSGEEIDSGLVLWFPGPRSETGEDLAELHVHGGRAVIAAVLRSLQASGLCRLAKPGEFTRRAFENGKLDLTAVEGLADLIEAETEAQRRQAVRQAGGALARLYEGWREEVISALALIEAAIDFSDEADVAADAVVQARGIAGRLAAAIEGHLDDGHRGEILREGFQVVIAGRPNVGKSSLLNALVRREAAIVSAEAGTTRDVIEVRLDLEGLPIVLSDTAGLRPVAGEVEREGIRRTIARSREADLLLWVMDALAPEWTIPADLAFGSRPVLRVMNKVDLTATAARHGPEGQAAVAVSALTGEGLAELLERLAQIARERAGTGELIALTQARHREALEGCLESLKSFLSPEPGDVELRAEDLRRAALALGRITGRTDAEAVLDQIFKRFCIGK